MGTLGECLLAKRGSLSVYGKEWSVVDANVLRQDSSPVTYTYTSTDDAVYMTLMCYSRDGDTLNVGFNISTTGKELFKDGRNLNNQRPMDTGVIISYLKSGETNTVQFTLGYTSSYPRFLRYTLKNK